MKHPFTKPALAALRLAALLSALVAGLSACSTTAVSSGGPPLPRDAKWAMLPIVNHTEVPQAGLRAEAVAEALLRARGIMQLRHYPPELNPDSLVDPGERKVQADAAKWARDQGIRYGLQGSVDEWRYKVGVDGEPAVGLALQVVDLQSGDVAWSAVGAKSGWSRESLSGVAQKLIRELLARAPLQ